MVEKAVGVHCILTCMEKSHMQSCRRKCGLPLKGMWKILYRKYCLQEIIAFQNGDRSSLYLFKMIALRMFGDNIAKMVQ